MFWKHCATTVPLPHSSLAWWSPPASEKTFPQLSGMSWCSPGGRWRTGSHLSAHRELPEGPGGHCRCPGLDEQFYEEKIKQLNKKNLAVIFMISRWSSTAISHPYIKYNIMIENSTQVLEHNIWFIETWNAMADFIWWIKKRWILMS